jgi:hypothetical protein
MPDTPLLTPAQIVQLASNQEIVGDKIVAIVPPPSRWQNCATFIRGVFSSQGEPSSSRILTFILALVSACILIGVVRHVCALKDPQTLSLWLGALPIFITSMTVFFLSPYTVKVGSASLSDVVGSFRKDKP